MANKTKAPTGLTVVRTGTLKFELGWKITDDNCNNQWVDTRVAYGNAASGLAWTNWVPHQVDGRTTSLTISYNTADYFPTTKKKFYGIQFRVCCDAPGQHQSEHTYKVYDQYVPRIPSASANWDENYENRCTFVWDTTVNDQGDNNPFINCEWQSILVKESNETDGSKLAWKTNNIGWRTGTGSRNSSVTITEETERIASNSYTRWFRVRSRGPGGNGWSAGARGTGCSYWRYAKHVYAQPKPPTMRSPIKEGNLLWINAIWSAPADASHPIDRTEVEYGIGIPKSNLAAPDDLSYTVVRTFVDTGGNDQAVFLIQDPLRLSLDQLIWVRISVTHDKNRRGIWDVVKSGKLPYNVGLQPPTNLTIGNVDNSTHRVDIHAEHQSQVPDSKIAIVYKETNKADLVVGILSHSQTDVTVICPNWGSNSFTFAVYEFQGSTATKTARGITTYTVTANMKSSTVSAGGNVPMPPTNIQVTESDTPNEAIVSWNWSWSAGTLGMEISWSTNPNAWESTDQPSTFIVSDIHAAKWRISGLDANVWYFRLRQTRENGDAVSYGPYSDVHSLDLTIVDEEEAVLPILSLSESIVPRTNRFTASWIYEPGTGSPQTYAEICEATVEEGETGTDITYGNIIAHTTTAKHVDINPLAGWQDGTTHFLCVRVKTKDKIISGWSAPVSIGIGAPVTCTITESSFEEVVIGEDEDERTVLALTEMPFTITVTGAGESDTTMLSIERTSDYHVNRPDENEFNGYSGETVLSYSQNGASEITIEPDDLVGYLDDTASYKLIATVVDSLGQVATEEQLFEVHWAHQALMPQGTVEILEEYGVAKLTPIAPQGTLNTDVCDIYRLSVDKPELVYEGADFGSSYVDPYPAIGEFGGYRFVFRTANNDYITADNVIAWLDVNSGFNTLDHIIDFGGDRVSLRYNVDLSNAWAKDFNETHYLGGSVQGDWNPSVSRTATVSGVSVIATDQDTIESMRRLAVYSGICHIRTRDGSSFDANIDVTESRGHEPGDLTANFTLSVTRVDPEIQAGMTYEQWINSI